MTECNPIEIVSLHKQYRRFTAVDGLNLSIERNSFTGLLGPNGAGKSTTLKILTSLVRPTSGHAYLNGADVSADPKGALTGVGAVIETPEFYGYLTPRRTFRYIGGLIGMTPESVSSETRGSWGSSAWRNGRTRSSARSQRACARGSPSGRPCWATPA